MSNKEGGKQTKSSSSSDTPLMSESGISLSKSLINAKPIINYNQIKQWLN